MPGPADRLLSLMYEWIKDADECSSNLRALAQELESLRKDCNIVETVGSTVAVAGSLAILAAPFTGGASLLAWGGAVIGGLGAGVSVITNITEHFLSSSKLKRVKEIDKNCNKIADEIQKLFQTLRMESPSSSKDERDKHVVKEFLKAMLRRSGRVHGDINVRVDSIHQMSNALVVSVLSMFSLRMEGALQTAAVVAAVTASVAVSVAAGGKQFGKAGAMVFKSSAKFLGGVVGLAISLPEAIQNWTEAIKKKHKTKASRSLTDMAQKIDPTIKRMVVMLVLIEVLLQKDSESDTEEEKKLKMALVNARSANKLIKPGDPALIDLIRNNHLDVLLITETWFRDDSQISTILPQDYTIVPISRKGRGGGVAIVHRKSLACAHVVFDVTSTFEVVAATVVLPGSTETVLILCIYRPPGRSKFRDFLTELRMFLIDAGRVNRNILIGGDFNVWVDRPEQAKTQDFLVVLHDNGFVQHVWQPTHRGGHILDLVLSRPNVRITNVSVEPNVFSDHYTVFFRASLKTRSAP